MSPYSHPVESIKDVMPYFKKDEKTFAVTFIGETLELRIPKRFEKYGYLEIGQDVTTLGVMDMIINEKYQTGLNLLASITITPSEIAYMTYNSVEYVVLKLKHGDTFMSSTRVLQDQGVVYVLWSEFITYGNPIYTLTYESFLSLFANVRELTGAGIGVSRSVYEGIVAHISRDSENVGKQYRLTDMAKPARLIALNSISNAPTSTIARLNGSYFRDEGLTAALRHQVNEQQPFENLLRGLSSVIDERFDDAVL